MAKRDTPVGEPLVETSPDQPDPTVRSAGPDPTFPIVGVGASAGGLDAFRQLLVHIPPDSGLAIVLVQHLDATRTSMLSNALAQATTMPVAQAEHGDRLQPNRVYVIPPGVQMGVVGGALVLTPLEDDERRPHLPIDHFFGSLAADRGRFAIGVILSGTAQDGTAGLTEIRARGGITFSQDPRSARYGEMPQSAVDAEVVDFCLPLPALGAELVRLACHPYLVRSEPVPPTPAGAALLAQVATLVQSATGVDFGEYKSGTFKRRLARRMAVRKVTDVAAYLEVLRYHPAEVRALYDDLLIGVTSFFRDEAGFDELKAIAFPEILKHKAPGTPIRAWVVGCSTGEEVYSLAISLLEHLGDGPPSHPIMIFGSDLSQEAVERARTGLYKDAAVRGLGEERLKRFFARTERGWRIIPSVRELCVFVRHDVARDPPFSKLDVVCCRNLLIYFGHALQRRVLSAVHYGLNQPGYLLLGHSESASGVPRWFAPTSHGGMVFLRKPGPSAFRFNPRPGAFHAVNPEAAVSDVAPVRTSGALTQQIDELVLARYAPPGVVVNDRLEVVQFRGRTGAYLEPPQGEPQSHLLKMARPGLAGPLRVLLAQARKGNAPVRRDEVTVEGKSGPSCDLVVLPLASADTGGPGFLVLFEERPPAPPGPTGPRRGPKRRLLDTVASQTLLDELADTKAQLASLIEDHVRGDDALSAANDDLMSNNEELQSLNEELETAKEEVQASNEELTTLNDELHDRNEELLHVNADVLNVLDAVEIPIVLLDDEQRIRRFSRRASAFLGLTPSDVGKQLAEVELPILAPDLDQWITRAVTESTLVEAEVHDRADRWHRLQVRPRVGPSGRPEGTILSLVDIDELRNEVSLAQWGRDYARSIVEAVQVPLLVLDAGLRVLSANGAYYTLFQQTMAETEGQAFFDLGAGHWGSSELRQAVTAALGPDGRFQALELERGFLGAGHRVLSVSGCAVTSPTRQPMILLAIEDVTIWREAERRRAELFEIAEEARRVAVLTDEAKNLFLAHLSHELRTPLTSILLHAQSLQRSGLDGPDIGRAGASIEADTRRQMKLVEDLLDISRITAGKLTLDAEAVDWPGLVQGVVEAVRPVADAKAVRLLLATEGEPPRCQGDPGRLRQVVANLVENAVKYTPSGGQVQVRTDSLDGYARLTVTDSGHGMDADFLPHAFERFAQEGTAASEPPGLGLGLSIVRDLMALHGGSVRAESPGRNLGSTFTVLLPRQVADAGAD